MKKLIIIIFLLSTIYASKENLISDYNFTNQNYNYDDYISFYTNFPQNKMTIPQKEIIYRVSRMNVINILVTMTKLQNETDLLYNKGGKHRYNWRVNRAMGYGMIHSWKESNDKYKFYKYSGFDIQVYLAGKLLRESFNMWKPEKVVKIYCDDSDIIPINASTFSIYRYNPFYGTHSRYGYESTGNKLFEIFYKQISDKWDKHLNIDLK